MKRKNVLNLIKYHIENDNDAFINEAYEIAKEFNEDGEYDLGSYILTLIRQNIFAPQDSEIEFQYLQKLKINSKEPLALPSAIYNDLLGITNAVSRGNIGINKFLFEGIPGTGKTEAAKSIGRILNKDVYKVNITNLIDSKLGQTQKNINSLFAEIEQLSEFASPVVLFDEIDSIALNRNSGNDVREMARATTEIFSCLDEVDKKIIIIATTNMFDYFDKALSRRFDYVVNFNRYTNEDLRLVAISVLNYYLSKYSFGSKDTRIFGKILNLCTDLPYPAEMKNLIKTSIAFSDPNDDKDYLRTFYKNLIKQDPNDVVLLKKQGFTVREVEVLTGVSKSSVSRMLREGKHE